LNTAVLFIVFNRPDLTRLVFKAIRQAAPTRLYVSADGPRQGTKGEKQICDQVRAIATNVDWDCELKTIFRVENLGCRQSCVSAIDWFFENEEMGIILEDDILPDHSFFRFCEELLVKYQKDENIMHINGVNINDEICSSNYSYYYSNIPIIWGWATWKNTWMKYDVNIRGWKIKRYNNNIFKKFNNKYVKYIFSKKFDLVYENKIDTWDYQYNFMIWVNEGVCITPVNNLIANIGFDRNATHTVDPNSLGSNLVSNKIKFPLVIKTDRKVNMILDDHILDKHYRCNIFFILLYKLYDYLPVLIKLKKYLISKMNGDNRFL
jgi:hypothetical protein